MAELGRVARGNPPFYVERIDAEAQTPAGGVDLLAVIKQQLGSDEQIRWHGHQSADFVQARFARACLIAICSLCVAYVCLSPVGHAMKYGGLMGGLGLALLLTIMGFAHIYVAISFPIIGWKNLVMQKYTMYAITTQRALRLSPTMFSLLTSKGRPRAWEIQVYTPTVFPKQIWGTAESAEALAKQFRAELEKLPGAQDAVKELHNTVLG